MKRTPRTACEITERIQNKEHVTLKTSFNRACTSSPEADPRPNVAPRRSGGALLKYRLSRMRSHTACILSLVPPAPAPASGPVVLRAHASPEAAAAATAAAATLAAPARATSSNSGGMPAGRDAPRAVAETIRGRGALRSPGRTTVAAVAAVVALPGECAGEEAAEAEAEAEAVEAAEAAGEAGAVDARSPRRGE